MNTRVALLMLVFILGLSACGPGQPTQEAPTATVQPLPSSTATFEPTATPVPTMTPTITPTVALPVQNATPIPQLGDPITPENAKDIVEVARWGNGMLNKATYSPDGKRIAVASSIGVALYDSQTLQRNVYIETETEFSELTFSPDSKILAGVSGATIQLWDVSSGAEIRKVDKDIKAIAALSPDGKTLAFGFNNGKIKLQDLSTDTDLRTINSGNTQVDLLLFSPDGKFLASTSGRFVKLWDVDSGKVLRSWGAQKLVAALAFSPDSKTLATGEADAKYLKQGGGKLFGGGEVELWDVANDTEHRSLGERTNPVLGVAFSPDGKTLATGESNIGLRLPPGSFLREISVKNLYSYVLGFGDYRDYGVKDLNSLVLWDVTSGTEIRTLGEHPEPINSLFFSPDGKTLLSSSMDGTINLWGMPDGKELRTLKLAAWYTSRNRSVALAPDGKVLATLSSNGSVTLLDMANGQELRSFGGSTVAIWAIGFSPDSKMLATGFGDGTVKVWEVDTGSELPISFGGHERAVINVAFLPDGKTLLSEDNYGELKFWDMASGDQIRTLAVGGSAFAFSSDGKLLAEGQEKINLRDLASGNGLCTLMMSANSVAFSPDNKLLASASDKIIALWDVIHATDHCAEDKAEWWGEGEFTPLLKLSGHTDEVYQVAFSPDGKLLVSASNDKTIKLWDVASGKELKTINAGAVYYVAFSPDGKYIVSASLDGTIRLWGVAP